MLQQDGDGNRGTIFVITSCDERRNKPFLAIKLGKSTENNKALLFFSGRETIQTFNGSIYAITLLLAKW